MTRSLRTTPTEVIDSLRQLLAVIDALPSLTDDDRQELRLSTWTYYVPLFMSAHLLQTQEEIDQLRQWYDMPLPHSDVVGDK